MSLNHIANQIKLILDGVNVEVCGNNFIYTILAKKNLKYFLDQNLCLQGYQASIHYHQH